MVHGGGLELAVKVAEVADVAWAALERHHEHSAVVVAREKDFEEVQGALELERLENCRLRTRLEEYEKALEPKQAPRHNGTSELYELLISKVDSPEFLCKLKEGNEGLKSTDPTLLGIKDDPNAWLMVSEKDQMEKEILDHDECGHDGYVILTQDDIVDGIASFMARYISSHPQTKAMTPQELQKAISEAFSHLEKKGKLRKLWNCGKFMYSAASWGATVVGVYKNPVIIRAASMALWTSCCLVVGLLR